jgi:hypothetical protein
VGDAISFYKGTPNVDSIIVFMFIYDLFIEEREEKRLRAHRGGRNYSADPVRLTLTQCPPVRPDTTTQLTFCRSPKMPLVSAISATGTK